ncbi:MAG: diguanylate cyclase [Pseudomonadota bacterium]
MSYSQVQLICLCNGTGRAGELRELLDQIQPARYRLVRSSDWPGLLASPDLAEAAAMLVAPAGHGPDLSEMLRQLRAQAPHLAVVVWLEHGQEEWQGRALALGAQDCLVDGQWRPEDLPRTLDRAISRQAVIANLRAEADFYRSVVEDQTEFICRLMPDGTISYANPAYCAYMGSAPDKAVGANLFTWLRHEEAGRLRAFLAGLSPEQPVGRIEHAYTTAQGEERWMKWTDRAFFDGDGRTTGYQCEGIDITERRHTEQALQTVEANLRQIFLSNADGMIVADPQGAVLFVNPAAEAILGRRAWDLVGKPFPFELGVEVASEMCLVHDSGRKLVVEMRVAETKWQGLPARLASLRDISELVELREELRALSLEDELTGLYNRRGFVTLARQLIKTALRMRRRTLLFFADLDDLKLINDRLGHREGDRALAAASRVLRATFRESDVVARVGGDEFAALALEADEDQTRPILIRLGENLEAYNRSRPGSYALSLSVGTAVYDPTEPRPLEDLMAEADHKMYLHKRSKPAAQ